MAAIFPFRALRPVPEAAPRVAAVPYDVVSTPEARALVSGNPLSFLRVTRAEVDLPPDTNPYGDQVYAQAVRNFEVLKRDAPFVFEEQPSLYLYRLRMGTHEQTGVAGCFSLDEYDGDLIKKHERTRKDKEDDRTKHMLELRAQTGVVFLTYRASASIDRLVGQAATKAPLFDFVASDGVAHTMWRLPDAAPFVQGFAELPALYIADGHHRVASAARARDMLRKTKDLRASEASEPRENHPTARSPRGGDPGRSGAQGPPRESASGGSGGEAPRPELEAGRFVAVAFPDNQVQILGYHRVVRDLSGSTPEAVLANLRGRMSVTEGRRSRTSGGRVEMFLDGRWYVLALPHAPAGTPRADTLDVETLEREVLTPVFGIGDIRTDKRIDFVGGARGTAELERRISSREAAAAFALHPVDVADLLTIADAGGIMPPKSTWFEPKLRDGLLTHLI